MVTDLKGQLHSTCPRCGEPGVHSSPADCHSALRLTIHHATTIETPRIVLGLLCSWCGMIVREPEGLPTDQPRSWSHGICTSCREHLERAPRRPSY